MKKLVIIYLSKNKIIVVLSEIAEVSVHVAYLDVSYIRES